MSCAATKGKLVVIGRPNYNVRLHRRGDRGRRTPRPVRWGFGCVGGLVRSGWRFPGYPHPGRRWTNQCIQPCLAVPLRRPVGLQNPFSRPSNFDPERMCKWLRYGFRPAECPRAVDVALGTEHSVARDDGYGQAEGGLRCRINYFVCPMDTASASGWTLIRSSGLPPPCQHGRLESPSEAPGGGQTGRFVLVFTVNPTDWRAAHSQVRHG